MLTDKLCNYENCSPTVKKQINNIVDGLTILLKNNLLGIYLHGSMVLDAFDEKSSDIDVIVVIDNCLSVSEKIDIGKYLLSLNNKPCPLDFEIITNDDFMVSHFYFSDYWASKYELITTEGENEQNLLSAVFSDGDIIVDLKLVKQKGICLYGIPINELFPDISDEIYFNSITSKVDDFYVESENDEQSSYLILTLCRILSFKKKGEIFSKRKAAEWALNELPSSFHPVILSALYKKYGFGNEVLYTSADALSFKSYVLKSIV